MKESGPSRPPTERTTNHRTMSAAGYPVSQSLSTKMPVKMTPAVSAAINARIGELCKTAKSGRELADQINREKRLNLHIATYKRRARKAGHRWPGRVVATREISAAIDQRIGELCRAEISGTELTAQMNQEFALGWDVHTYWKRARAAGHRWPGGSVPRLTKEESQQVDERFRELCKAAMAGMKIRETINAEMGLKLTLSAYFARAQRLGLPWKPTPKTGQFFAQAPAKCSRIRGCLGISQKTQLV
jgi:hypothetical protein